MHFIGLCLHPVEEALDSIPFPLKPELLRDGNRTVFIAFMCVLGRFSVEDPLLFVRGEVSERGAEVEPFLLG